MSNATQLRIPPALTHFKRDKVTVAQIDKFEAGHFNYLRQPVPTPKFSDKFRSLLDARHKRPVAKDRGVILKAVQENQVVVVASPTGSGKTTEIPQLMMFNELSSCKLVACTQPRRLAAISVAEFVAAQRDVPVGEEVGYKVRFNNKTDGRKTRLLYMTDGMLLQELKSAPVLSNYGCIIIDEAHERTLATDILLPFLRAATKKRADLKIIIMSATIDAMKFRQYFAKPDGSLAPFYEVGGSSYPVKISYLATASKAFIDDAAKTVASIHTTAGPGDILVFLPGEDEISSLGSLLRGMFPDNLVITPVFSTQSEDEQNGVFKVMKEGVRKVVLATNIAETSLTIDGIVHVVDSGLARQNSWNPRLGGEALILQSATRASAVQRTGRAGRTAPGECWRLYTAKHFSEGMVKSAVPDIKRSDLAPTVLNIMAMGFKTVKQVWDFDFLDRPYPEQFFRAFEDLSWMGFIDNTSRMVEKLAVPAARLPVYPAWYLAILKASELGCVHEIVAIAAVMSTQGILFRRPKVARLAADEVHKQFWNPLSDHLTYLNAYNAYRRAEKSGKHTMAKWCHDHFINEKVAKEAQALAEQLVDICKWLGIPYSTTDFALEDFSPRIRKAIAFGFSHRSALLIDPEIDAYMNTHGQCFGVLDPDSALVTQNNEWIIYDKLTSSGGPWYYQAATAFELDWLLDLDFFQSENIPRFHEKKMQRIKDAIEKVRMRRSQAGAIARSQAGEVA